MPRVHLYRHPFASIPEVFEDDGVSIGEWLIAHYGPSAPAFNVYVYEGHPSAVADVTGNIPALVASDAPFYTVLEAPGGPLAPILINFAVAYVLSAIVNRMNRPDKPLDNRDQQSANNQLSERANAVRLLQRVEDIYGTVRAVPSLMMPSYDKYIEHRRVEYGYFCVGRGYYELADVRDGDTAIADITGASVAAYKPFTSPNSGDAPFLALGEPIIDDVLNVHKSTSVDGIVLKPFNQNQLSDGSMVRMWGPPYEPGTHPFESDKDVVLQPEVRKQPNFQAIAQVGQTVTITTVAPVTVVASGRNMQATAPSTFTASTAEMFRCAVVGGALVTGGFAEPENNGTFTIASVSGAAVTVTETTLVSSFLTFPTSAEFPVEVNQTRTIADVGNGFIGLSGAAQFPLITATGYIGTNFTLLIDNDTSDWTDWITLADAQATQVWTNVVARQGMYRDDGAKSETAVTYEFEIERLDPTTLAPTGTVVGMTGEIRGATANERAETLERVTGWTGPSRIRGRRVTPFDYTFSGTVVDEITWTDVYAVSPVDAAHFGNKTTLHTITQATTATTGLQQRELNCLASRLLPTYNGSAWSGAFNADGLLVSGAIHPTSRVVDILAALTQDPKIGNRPLADLDVAQVWATQQALDAWHAQVGQFNYTFDNDEMSYEETVVAVAKAAFCDAYRQGGVIRLALDRPQSTSVGLFTHRNKQPDAETITRRFANDADYDGVELAYMDPQSEAMETIRLPLGGSFTKLKRVEVSGIRSYEQAWFHASREYARIYNERLSLETGVTVDARALLPNSRIDVVDNTRFRAWDGDVIAQAGLTLTLSRDVEFLAGEPHSLILKKRDGTPQVIAATPGPAANMVVLAAPPAEALVTQPTPEEGVRTTFSLAADVARAAQSWLVQQLSIESDGYVRLLAVNYTSAYYAADSEPVPPKSSVIDD